MSKILTGCESPSIFQWSALVFVTRAIGFWLIHIHFPFTHDMILHLIFTLTILKRRWCAWYLNMRLQHIRGRSIYRVMAPTITFLMGHSRPLLFCILSLQLINVFFKLPMNHRPRVSKATTPSTVPQPLPQVQLILFYLNLLNERIMELQYGHILMARQANNFADFLRSNLWWDVWASKNACLLNLYSFSSFSHYKA